jgi:RNA binding activity-knot of a chromodomain.
VSYIGWGSEWNEWITKHRIVGNEKIEILLDDIWYEGEILQKKDNQFFVRYNGYDTCYDEWVNKSRIKFN